MSHEKANIVGGGVAGWLERNAAREACWWLLLVALGSLGSACFDPRYPQGIPCSEVRTCPPRQICDVDDMCRVSPLPAPDASTPATPDARTPAALDARTPLVLDASTPDTNPRCQRDEDCPDGLWCSPESLCIAPTCRDGARNGGETDMDCGGGCPGCALGRACETGLDCQSGACTDRVCTEPPPSCEACDVNAACVALGSAQPCQCRSGYEGNGFTCADIDECAWELDDCGANATCTNTGGAFSCACNPGFQGDGVTCADIDECGQELDDCGANATCTNTGGAFSCACNPGFQGDGVTCADIDECGQELDDCGANATCTNTDGAFSCACNPGFQGDGVTCADIDECGQELDDCGANATCTNTDGAFSCACNPGFYGDGVTCARPRSCAELMALDPGVATGVYRVDPDRDGPIVAFDVFCDMVTAGGGWTVIEKSPFRNPIGRALYQDVPFNAAAPSALPHRLSRSQMQALVGVSTDMRIDCRGNDRLVTAAQNLFNGQYAPDNCTNATRVLYKEASLLGRLRTNVEICTWYVSTRNGCAGAWHIDEHFQRAVCNLPDHPWTSGSTAITRVDSDTFAVDPFTSEPATECHRDGAIRFVMLR
jgi:hypothetical protein